MSLMINASSRDKYTDVIHRLSSRVNKDQNQSAMPDYCCSTAPLCFEKSFYQYKSDAGQECCVEMCGMNNWNESIYGTETNEGFSSPMSSYRDQFTSSRIFDKKSEYIDYIVSNVLRQVVNHIPFDCLQRLSCCLPENIDNILCHTDMDSDRLIRILVADALQSYGTTTRQLTDWYAFANLVKPVLALDTGKDGDIEKIPSKQDKSSRKERSSERIANNRIQSTFTTASASPMMKKRESSETIAFDKITSLSTDAHMSSDHRSSSIPGTSQRVSPINSSTPMSVHAKEEFTPVGSRYQSKIKLHQTSIHGKSDAIDQYESLPFREKSTIQPSSTKAHQIPSDPPSAHLDNRKFNKSSDQSSSSECVLTIHHKYRHKGIHHNHPTTSSQMPVSRSLTPSVTIKKSGRKSKQISSDVLSTISKEKPTLTPSQQNISWNSTNIEESKASDSLSDRQVLRFKLLSSAYDTTNDPHQHENSSIQQSSSDEREILPLINEGAMSEQSIVDDQRLALSEDLEKQIIPLNENGIRMETDLILSKKKVSRINHYPNMLADFD